MEKKKKVTNNCRKGEISVKDYFGLKYVTYEKIHSFKKNSSYTEVTEWCRSPNLHNHEYLNYGGASEAFAPGRKP